MSRAAAAPPDDAAGTWRLEILDAVPSTQDPVIRRAEAGEAEGLALMACRQTAGRGRGGRAWDSQEGNLHLSVLLRPPGPAREAAQWSLLAGVALAEAAAAGMEDPAPLRLKWPNDLLLGEAKVAGILAEAALAQGDGGPDAPLAWLVLGFGVNLAYAPGLPDGRPTAVLPGAVAPEAFARRLLGRLGHWQSVQAARGFAPVRDAWTAHGPAPGAPLAVRGGGGAGPQDAAGSAPLRGRFAGLAEDGSLLLAPEVGGGPARRVAAGEIVAEEG